jgi:hypothetical protein
MANTFTNLGTVSGGVLNMTFSSIPQTYKKLMIIGNMNHGLAFGYTSGFITFNGDTNTAYNFVIQGWGGSNISSRQVDDRSIRPEFIGGTTGSGDNSPFIMTLPDYTNTTRYKTTQFQTGVISSEQGTSRMWRGAGWWENTSAITSITFTGSSSTAWDSISRLTLYGISGT